MYIGVVKRPQGENRIAIHFEQIKSLLSLNVEVLVERNSGLTSHSSNEKYIEAGAQIFDRKEILSKADVIVSIHPVEPISEIPSGKILIGMYNPFQNTSLINEFLRRDITCFSMDLVPRTTRAQAMDVLSSMAMTAGYKAVLIAAYHLPNFFPMFMTAAGSFKPAKVLVLGAGVAGLQAIATAKRLGAIVEAFDVRTAAKEEVQSLGAKFIEVAGAIEQKSAGGYAVEQSEEFKQRQKQLIQDHASKADVIISTAQIPGKKAPLLITKETVKKMGSGSVIIDLAASSGGNCELTENNKIINVNGVTIIGDSNLPSGLPVDASKMYGKNIINFLKLIIQDGKLNLNFDDDIVKATCVTHHGEIINDRLKATFNTEKV